MRNQKSKRMLLMTTLSTNIRTRISCVIVFSNNAGNGPNFTIFFFFFFSLFFLTIKKKDNHVCLLRSALMPFCCDIPTIY
jgi:hypothetical protein